MDGDGPHILVWLGRLLALFCLTLLAGQLFVFVNPQDEGQLLTYPWLVARGWVPYRDFWMPYPPATYFLLAGLFKLGLPGLAAERAVGLIVRVLYVLLLNRAITRSWSRISWIGVSVSFGLLFVSADIRAYSWTVGSLFLLTALLTARRHPAASACLFAAAGLCRFEFAVAGLVCLASLGILDRGSRQIVWKYVRSALLLVLCSVAAYGLLDIATSGKAIEDVLYDPIVLMHTHLVSIASPPLGLLGLPIEIALCLSPVLMIFLGVVTRRPYMVATNLATMTLLPQFFQRSDASHLFGVSAIVVSWALVGLAELLREPSDRTGWRIRASTVTRVAEFTATWIGVTVGAWCLIILLAYAVYLSPLLPSSPQFVGQIGSRVVRGANPTVDLDIQGARADRQVVDYVTQRAHPGEQIFISPASFTSAFTRTDLYYVLGLTPATPYLEFEGGIETRPTTQREIADRLTRCRWIVLLQGGTWYAPGVGVPNFVEQYIRGHYHAVMENPTYKVLVRKQ